MKKAVLALLAILILGGGAGGAYYYFEQPAEASVGATEEHQAAKEDHGAEDGDHHAFVELSPLILPVIDSEGINQIINLVVVIEVGDDQKAELVRKMEPRLKDAYIQELYGVLNKHAALKGGVIQIDMLKERLDSISNRVMGEDVVDEVLLQVVQQRPI